jgi:catechol 2,3-dioxygenase-like lactoylglutathione lyase family enzyme
MKRKPSSGVVVGAVVVDVNDLEKQAEFWTALLGSEILGREPDWVDIARLGESGPLLSLQRVPEGKAGKNRLHLDIMVDDFAVTSSAALDLGASPASPLYEAETTPWQIFHDPEGNEFCLISHY